ncbi:MAG TPA: nucleotidyltransferase domain-containing protein [Solirubrobacterales bacterium]|nr:nucleotidyltransferase domain-containing protein [Solirubrobacterales bacterium]
MNELVPLAEEVGVSERTLRRAVNEGTLRGHRASPRKLRLPAAEKEYVRGHWALLAQLREALRTESNVRFALLFGSTARGDDTEESDIDLLVEMRDSSFMRTIDLALKLQPLLGKEVQVLTIEDAESNPLLLAEAAREGRVIVDREGRWPQFRDRKGSFERRARARYRKQMERVFGRPSRKTVTA